MSIHRSISETRLFAAADKLLNLMQSEQGMSCLIEMAFDESQPANNNPIGGPFTQSELVEAMSMLIRMGYVEGHDRCAP